MELNEKLRRWEAELRKILPGLNMQISRDIETIKGINKVKELYTYVPESNQKLSDSLYYYNDEELLVHFTNGSSLLSILKEKSIRLYNLINLNDPREYQFGGKLLKLDKTISNQAKKDIFVISFCGPNILHSDDYTSEFNMWRIYGNNGRGIAILFKIINNPINWMNFHISKVFYGDGQRETFEKIQNLIDDLNQSLPIFSIDLGKLLPFHKSELYSSENEIRIINDRRLPRSGTASRLRSDQNEQLMPKIKPDIQKLFDYKDLVSYISIPIYYNGYEDTKSEIPLLKIEKIFFGYNYLDRESRELIKYLSELCKDQIGYAPEVIPSRLRKIYFDIKKK